MTAFDKYEKLGPYHWEQISRSISRHNIFTSARYDTILGMLDEEKPVNVLDVGCGDAALSQLLCMQGAQVVGLDVSLLALSHAVRMTDNRDAKPMFVQGSALELPFDETVFDCVTAIDIVEHLDAPAVMIRECVRVLQPGGVLVLSTPQKLTQVPIDPLHVREFYADELVDFLSEYLTEVSVIQTHPVVVAELFWHLRARRLVRYAVNFVSIYLNKNPFKWARLGRFHVMLAAKGRKPV